ncbi:hypothetical protein [Candidatus Cardinium hertigii]|uniref:hypothetical protein n=1 Tax=Candidatus Cardinium hertigii TaxID=247481 RepID=UPI003D7CF8A5
MAIYWSNQGDRLDTDHLISSILISNPFPHATVIWLIQLHLVNDASSSYACLL